MGRQVVQGNIIGIQGRIQRIQASGQGCQQGLFQLFIRASFSPRAIPTITAVPTITPRKRSPSIHRHSLSQAGIHRPHWRSCSSSSTARFSRNVAMTGSSVPSSCNFCWKARSAARRAPWFCVSASGCASDGQIAQQQAHLIDDIQFFILVPRYEIRYRDDFIDQVRPGKTFPVPVRLQPHRRRS